MNIRKWFTLDDRRSLIPMGIAVICVAITRQIWWQYLIGMRGPFGLLAIPLVGIPFLILVCTWMVVLSVLAIRSIWHRQGPIPILFLIIGTVLALIIPLPTRPDTPEKRHFLEHRAQYEAVVILARYDQLREDPDSRFLLSPETLLHLSRANGIDMFHDDVRGLVVFFFPFDEFLYHFIAYVEFDDVEFGRFDNPCGPTTLWYVEQKIDDHWYVCEADWN